MDSPIVALLGPVACHRMHLLNLRHRLQELDGEAAGRVGPVAEPPSFVELSDMKRSPEPTDSCLARSASLTRRTLLSLRRGDHRKAVWSRGVGGGEGNASSAGGGKREGRSLCSRNERGCGCKKEGLARDAVSAPEHSGRSERQPSNRSTS